MTRLLRVELRRVLHRRAVRLLLVLPLIGLVISFFGALHGFTKTTPQQEQTRAAAIDYIRAHPGDGDPCSALWDPHDGAPTVDLGPAAINGYSCGVDEAGNVRIDFYPPQYELAKEWPNAIGFAVVMMALAGFLVGATSVGAEWAAGTYAHLLTWVPRRTRVVLAKTLAPALVVMAASVVVLAAATGVAALSASLRGTSAGAGDVAWGVVKQGLRGLLVAGGLTAVGTAVAHLARNSAASLGALVAYLILGEGMLRNGVESSQPWLLVTNATALVRGHETVSWGETVLASDVPSTGRVVGSEGGLSFVEHTVRISAQRGGLFVLVVVALLVGAGALATARRDAS